VIELPYDQQLTVTYGRSECMNNTLDYEIIYQTSYLLNYQHLCWAL